MKKLFLIVSILFVLTSCEKYEQPKFLTLSGEYIIDKVTYEKIDNYTSYDDSIYQPGTVYINRGEVFPMDTINVGITKWHFDYSVISMCPMPTQTGQYIWNKQYFYNVINHNSNYDLGYLEFICEGRRRVFKILDDGLESMTLRSTGDWGYTVLGSDVQVTLYLTRVGP